MVKAKSIGDNSSHGILFRFPWRSKFFKQQAWAGLDRFETADSVQLLNSKQLQSGLGRKSSPNGDKASPQTENTIVSHGFDQTIDKSIVNLLVRGLVHEAGSQVICWAHSASHEKT